VHWDGFLDFRTDFDYAFYSSKCHATRNFMKRTLIILFSFACHALAQEAAQPGFKSITSQDLRKHVLVLASDSLAGRETSFPGQRKAAEYIASQFSRIGLKPIGTNNTFLQPFDVTVTRIDPATNMTVSMPQGKKTLFWGKEFISESGRDTLLTAPVAFIGHTDCEINDVDRASLAGRIVFVLAGKKEHVSDTSRSQVMRRLFAQRKEPTAAAVIIIGDDSGPGAIEAVMTLVRGFGGEKGSMRLGVVPSQRATSPLRYFLSASIADEILQSANRSLRSLRTDALRAEPFTPILLDNVQLTIDSRVLREIKQTENVVGFLEGSDSSLRKEVVVLSGHYDHLGTSSNGDIYYGADDDASGTSAVIEIAEAFAANPVRPKRSVLFLAVTGEEKGLFGSAYYTSNPIIPLDRTMADLNIDMIGRVDTSHANKNDERYIYVIGADKISTELDSILIAANQATEQLTFDLTYNDERDPNQFYRRSDHYNFARNGVPVVFFFSGIHADNHRPSDTPDKLLYDRMASITRMIYATAWRLAEMPRMLVKNVQQTKP
jgi:hypothetical protein